MDKPQVDRANTLKVCLRSLNHEVFHVDGLRVTSDPPTRAECLPHASGHAARRASPLSSALLYTSVLSRLQQSRAATWQISLLALPDLPAHLAPSGSSVASMTRGDGESGGVGGGGDNAGGSNGGGDKDNGGGGSPWVRPSGPSSRRSRNFAQRILVLLDPNDGQPLHVVDVANSGAFVAVTALELQDALAQLYGWRDLNFAPSLSHSALFALMLQQLIQAEHAADDLASLQMQHRWADLLTRLNEGLDEVPRGGHVDGVECATWAGRDSRGDGTRARESSAWIHRHGGTPDFYPSHDAHR